MTVEEKAAAVEEQSGGELPEGIKMQLVMLNQSLDEMLAPSRASIKTTVAFPAVAAFSDLLRDYGGNTLLTIVRGFLPVDGVRAVRARAPRPATTSECLVESYVTLLRLINTHGPVTGATRRGVTVAGSGQLVTILLAESTDGISLAKGLGHDTVNNMVTGFVDTLSHSDLEKLGGSSQGEVNTFIASHPMVGTSILTMLSGVSGTASAPVMVSYRAKLGTAADIEESRKPLWRMILKCAECLASGADCQRQCSDCSATVFCGRCRALGLRQDFVQGPRPCFTCLEAHIPCVVGQLISCCSDCESGKIGFSEGTLLPKFFFVGQFTFIKNHKDDVDQTMLPDAGHLAKLYRNGICLVKTAFCLLTHFPFPKRCFTGCKRLVAW